MADKEAGAPLPSDDPDYGMLPPKALEKLFGIDIVVSNPDEPGDGIFEVIRDRKGNTIYLRNPKTRRWLRAEGPTAQRLVHEAQNNVVVDCAPTLLPIPIERNSTTLTRKRKRDDDVGEPAQAVAKKDRVQQKKDARRHWRIAGTALRFSARVQKQRASSHTGCSLDFEKMDI